MKNTLKIFVALSVLLVPLALLAQTIPVTVPVPTTLVGFDFKVFIQQVLTNGGLFLLSFLLGKVPGVGPLLQKFLDMLMGNPKH